MNLNKPHLKDDALLADIAAARDVDDHFHLWWLGQSGFLLQWRGQHLLFDPYLSDSLTRKYADTDKPHTRMTELVIEPGRLDFIDVATSSHNHTDHLDGETLTALMTANESLKFVVPEANRDFIVNRLACENAWPIGLNDGESTMVGPFTFHAVPAAHEDVKRDREGQCHYLGFVVEFAGYTIYHSGDTMLYEGMVDILKPFNVDVAILPINGRSPERRVAGNLWGREAAQLASDIGASIVIPCHYDMFAFNTATPHEFAETCETLGQRYAVLQNGQRWSSDQ